MKPMFESREVALAAPGLVYQHWKGGVYRVARYIRVEDLRHNRPLDLIEFIGRPVTSTWDGEAGLPLQDLVVYEHLWPHPHQYYVRTAEEFFDHAARPCYDTDLGPAVAMGRKQRRFTPVTTDEARLMGQTDRLYVRELNP